MPADLRPVSLCRMGWVQGSSLSVQPGAVGLLFLVLLPCWMTPDLPTLRSGSPLCSVVNQAPT